MLRDIQYIYFRFPAKQTHESETSWLILWCFAASMVESPAIIVFQILYTIIYGTASTIITLFHLFFKLLLSLSFAISTGGFLGILLSILILVPVIYVLIRFFSGGIVVILISSVLLLLFLFMLLILL